MNALESRLGRTMKSLLLALSFLTVIPVKTSAPQAGDLGRAAMWFPFIGLGLGAALAAAHTALGFIFPPLLTAALVVALWAAITGGLHLDGLADCCDGLLAAASPERRLDIMRDPRVGAFGVVGVVLFLAIKIGAVASLAPGSTPYVFLLAPGLARWLILPVAVQPPARAGGMGADFALGLNRLVFTGAALIPITLMIIGGWQAVIAVALAHAAAFAVIALARARLGGVTGDVFGLTVEIAELAILLAFAFQVPSVP